MIRKRLTFIGRVQGVGFRYRAYHAAQGLRLTGWVMNNWDGTVLMEVQGQEDEIDKLITMSGGGTFIMIDRIESKTIPLVEDERSFKVRHGGE